MTLIGSYTDEEFKADYELEFADGIRGAFITSGDRKIGLLMAHVLNGVNDDVCGGSVYWESPQKDVVVPLWAVKSMKPLTLGSSIRCSCGLHGHIVDGFWIPEDDST